MKTVQMTIDERLLAEVDEAAAALAVTRSAFVRDALRLALRQQRGRRLEALDAAGYRRLPAEADQADEWLSQQAWGDGWNEAT
ncbi:MAG: ribbon-helix-helix domain-containing protein [Candidatus Promineifilaceae bacterium]